jgi:hypothetical protein
MFFLSCFYKSIKINDLSKQVTNYNGCNYEAQKTRTEIITI